MRVPAPPLKFPVAATNFQTFTGASGVVFVIYSRLTVAAAALSRRFPRASDCTNSQPTILDRAFALAQISAPVASVVGRTTKATVNTAILSKTLFKPFPHVTLSVVRLPKRSAVGVVLNAERTSRPARLR